MKKSIIPVILSIAIAFPYAHAASDTDDDMRELLPSTSAVTVMQMEEDVTKIETKPWYKSKKFWIGATIATCGVVAVTSAITWALNHENENSSATTTANPLTTATEILTTATTSVATTISSTLSTMWNSTTSTMMPETTTSSSSLISTTTGYLQQCANYMKEQVALQNIPNVSIANVSSHEGGSFSGYNFNGSSINLNEEWIDSYTVYFANRGWWGDLPLKYPVMCTYPGYPQNANIYSAMEDVTSAIIEIGSNNNPNPAGAAVWNCTPFMSHPSANYPGQVEWLSMGCIPQNS